MKQKKQKQKKLLLIKALVNRQKATNLDNDIDLIADQEYTAKQFTGKLLIRHLKNMAAAIRYPLGLHGLPSKKPDI